MALEITDSNFEDLVLKSKIPVMVDFWAEWCGPCRMVGPIIEEISSQYEGKALVGKLEIHGFILIMKMNILNIMDLLIVIKTFGKSRLKKDLFNVHKLYLSRLNIVYRFNKLSV